MLILENIALAFTALISNKMRSLLTMLGIIIGIGSVIAIVTVGNSLSNSISSSMQSMGANNIMVGLQQRETEEERTESGMAFRGPERYREPTEEDYFTDEMLSAYLENYSDEVKALSISDSLGQGQVTRGTAYANVSLIGVNACYFAGTDITMLTGNMLTPKALSGGKAVAMVSDYFVNNLFDGDQEEALGKEIEVLIGRDFYALTIIGVYEYQQTMMSFTSVKDTRTDIYVPLGYVQKKNHMFGKYSGFTVVTNSGVDSSSFMTSTKRFFDRWYHSNKDMTVSAFSLESMVSALTDMMDKVSIAISVIAGISLLVGGIGVMNIMMVSISERTREIGTRKALGATNGSIRLQFIVEAMVLCLVGGVFGILLGIGGGALGAKLLGYEASPTISSILISLLFSLAIGVFFGFYPANKAAQMNPIDALRYE
ncbi:MAG: ABC transporter permease [Lachnospiraceae bacterium]|nr:ABC transporter permease [Lachnospiraceae bacterium]